MSVCLYFQVLILTVRLPLLSGSEASEVRRQRGPRSERPEPSLRLFGQQQQRRRRGGTQQTRLQATETQGDVGLGGDSREAPDARHAESSAGRRQATEHR